MTKKRRLLSVTEYEAMGYEQLFKEVERMLSQGQRLMTWFSKDERVAILPALTALRNLSNPTTMPVQQTFAFPFSSLRLQANTDGIQIGSIDPH